MIDQMPTAHSGLLQLLCLLLLWPHTSIAGSPPGWTEASGMFCLSSFSPFFSLRLSTATCRAYNFQTVLTASSVIYSYAGIAPAVIWGVFKQYDKNLKFITILCLYGYSLISFIPAIVRSNSLPLLYPLFYLYSLYFISPT